MVKVLFWELTSRYGENRLRTFEPDRVRITSSFRAKRIFRLTQVNPGLSFLAPPGRARRAVRLMLNRYRHFVPGYYQPVPPGQKPFTHRRTSH
jgi:hypothetical protein